MLLCAPAQNEITFKNAKAFKKDYYTYYVKMCRRLAKEGKVPAEHKDTLKDNLVSALEWIEANFDSLQVRCDPLCRCSPTCCFVRPH
jgi:hypothetical protein